MATRCLESVQIALWRRTMPAWKHVVVPGSYGHARRTYATTTSMEPATHTNVHADRAQYLERKKQFRRAGELPVIHSKPVRQPTTIARRFAVMELRHLADPMKLANRVRDLLAQDDRYEQCLEMARIAGRSMNCVVSWNHIIEHNLRRHAVKEAFSLYNEMKKRGQFPDAYTIAIILRGLKDQPLTPDNLGRGLALYHSLSALNSRVKTTLTHTNAMLKLCAAHNALTAMWGVIGTMPERGPLSADVVTYSTVLSAIRAGVIANTTLQGHSYITTKEEYSLRDDAVADGIKVWQDVISRWRRGDLRLDEEIVNTMGKLLCLGLRPIHWDHVLSLLAQTMNIPRLVPRFDEQGRTASHLKGIRVRETITKSAVEDPYEIVEQPEQDADNKALELVDRHDSAPSTGSGVFVKPGVRILSLVMEVCRKMRIHRAAHEYWNLLTQTHGVEPDMDNYHCYLRVLRQSHSSARVVELMQQLATGCVATGEYPVPKTYRIAMSACTRDAKNPRTLDHASQLVTMMLRQGSAIDVIALENYLKLCIGSRAAGPLMEAYDKISPVIGLDDKEIRHVSPSGPARLLDDAEKLTLASLMHRCVQILLESGLVLQQDIAMWSARRARLPAMIQSLRGEWINHKFIRTTPVDSAAALITRRERPYQSNRRMRVYSSRKGQPKVS